MTQSASPPVFSVSWATCPKWATRAESEAVDVFESLDGARTVALVDVQGSGSAGGRKLALSLLGYLRGLVQGGAQTSTALSAVNDHLRALRAGKVGAAIHLAAISENAIEVVGYGPLTLWSCGDEQTTHQFSTELAGRASKQDLESCTYPVPATRWLVLANDGIAKCPGDLITVVTPWSEATDAADLLSRSMSLDGGRARSDKSIVVIRADHSGVGNRITAGSVSFPVSTKLDRL